MELPTDRPASASTSAAARRVIFGFGAREMGLAVVGLAVLVSGIWYRSHSKRNERELTAIHAQLAAMEDAADYYREKFDQLSAAATQVRSWADSQNSEPIRTWARERARLLEALVAQVDREREARDFARESKEIERLCADGDAAAARARIAQLPDATFPPPAEFAQLRHDGYEVPLAQFSRQNPDSYRALHQNEPDVAKQDEAALRTEIAAAKGEVTPQQMFKVDLLAAVAAKDDPLVAEWSALTSAIDYFENPDETTRFGWQRAQHALQQKDWQTAAKEMQAIVDSKVRTRQPFRAAFGWALLKSRPDDPVEAYPYLAEAAAAGNKQARTWVATEDYRQKRYPQAQRWIEAAIADGETEGIPILLELYEKHAGEIANDPGHELGMLKKVTDQPDAPAEAWLLMGRVYERADPPGSKASAFACYNRAKAKGSASGAAEIARCAMAGIGTTENLELARDAACQAFAEGEREKSVPILIELMRRAPARSAGAIQRLFEQEQLAGGGGYLERHVVDGPGVAQLKGQLAQYLDNIGMYGQAARFYAASRDPAALKRRTELTTGHPCETCGGTGKVQVSVPCPTCGGTGKHICSYCGGTGYIFVPGTPPCTTCGGSGTMVQDRKVVVCAACGGTGKGKGSVIKQDCSHCDHGYIKCTDCVEGFIKVTKECPDCHGKGTWSLVDRSSD